MDKAKSHPIREALKRIAHVRKESVALQRGVQVNLEFTETTASFLRVYEVDGKCETAWVVLNKSDKSVNVGSDPKVQQGVWTDAISGEPVRLTDASSVTVPAHGVRVFINNAYVSDEDLVAFLN